MTQRHIAFAVPGDLTTLTGGYIYDRRLMTELRALGWTVDHIALPDGFPNPSAQQMAEALGMLQDVPSDCPVIIDGLAFGALDTGGVAQIKAPIIALVHHPLAKESGLSTAQARALWDMERQNLSHAAHILVPSPHTGDILTSEYDVAADKITIAKPGIDQATGPSTPVDPPLILSVGIQLPRKGHDVLLKALAEIKDLDWKAVIVGAPLDAGFAQELQDLRTTLDLTDRVELAGQVSQEALKDIYQTAGLFALATRYEGYGIVFDEALVHGLPIVSCHAGAVSDTVPAGAGHLVAPDDPQAFGAALRLLLSDEERRQVCAAASKKAGAALLGWDQTARVVAKAIQQKTNCAEQIAQ